MIAFISIYFDSVEIRKKNLKTEIREIQRKKQTFYVLVYVYSLFMFAVCSVQFIAEVEHDPTLAI